MARISGVDLPRDKRVEIGLTYVYGIGRPTATKILEKAKVNPDQALINREDRIPRTMQGHARVPSVR